MFGEKPNQEEDFGGLNLNPPEAKTKRGKGILNNVPMKKFRDTRASLSGLTMLKNNFEIKIRRKNILVNNLCGINSLFHGLAELCIQNEATYKAFQGNSGLFQEILEGVILNEGKSKEIQIKMYDLLKNLEIASKSNNSLNCISPFESVFNCLYPSYSMRTTFGCCPDKWDKYLELNCTSNYDLEHLDALLKEKLEKPLKCYCQLRNDGLSTVGRVVALETFLWKGTNSDSVLVICLSEIPKIITIKDLIFNLSFIVAYEGAGGTIGHYVTYSKTDDNDFTLLDDLQKVPSFKITKKIIKPVFLIYSLR